MPVDPKSIAPGKRYVTATRHVRTVLEVTDERVRYAYGGGEPGGVSQWRWQTKAKFAEDAAKELISEEASSPTPSSTKAEKQENAEPAKSNGPKPLGGRDILSKRR